jgi:RNA polymerase sigma-70 factor (ECF subfamily)
MTGSDDALKNRLVTNLDDAFPVLLQQMHGLVYNAARRWLPTHHDAEDVTQEVFVRAYRALGEYSHLRIAELRLRPWLFTITLNLCRNHARTRNRRPAQTSLEPIHDGGAATSAEDDAVHRVVVDEWRDRLSQLQPRQRDAIVLRHVVGLSYGEIGEVLQRPAGTIKSDVHRGLERLRSQITTEELL